MTLQQLSSCFCFHDSTLQSIQYSDNDGILTMVIDDYFYDENLNVDDQCRQLQISFGSCKNIRGLENVTDGSGLFDCSVTGNRITFILIESSDTGISKISFEAARAETAVISFE